MNLVKLADISYTAINLVTGYTSLIWTERFSSFGEFELKTYDVAATKSLLPVGTFVSILESDEMMRVETHSTTMEGTGADAREQLVITGRSAAAILENRFVEGKYQKKRRMRQKYSATGAAGVLIWNAINNTSGKDVTRGDNDPDPDTRIDDNDYSWNTLDALPNVCVTDSVADDGNSRWFRLEEGMLWPQLKAILDRNDASVRCLRPVPNATGTIFTVATALESRGQVTRTYTEDITKLRFDLYQGTDRTATVILRDLMGHLDNQQYLESIVGYATEMEMRSGEVSIGDIYRPGDEGLSGWSRFVTDFDAGSPELPPEPDEPKKPKSNASQATKNQYDNQYDNWVEKHAKWKNKRDAIVADFKDEQKEAAAKELKRRKKLVMFLGDVTSDAPYKYRSSYFLGDKIMLIGKNGVSSPMIVAEFIRTEDANGDRGLPGLVAPDQ